jgi:EAL domain-containing protein (putative c-di-GMP-specific phosphodiesterase class I)
MQRFAALLGDEARADSGCLLLVRVADLVEVNRALGRDTADRALRAVAEVLRTWHADPGAMQAGRMNGADFALAVSGSGGDAQDAQRLADALRTALREVSDQVVVHVGGARWSGAAAAGALLARADLALARAEGLGAFAAELDADAAATVAAAGEQVWHRHLQDAIAERRARLAEFVVVQRGGVLSHLECPLRLQLMRDGAYESAARWLPLALRSRLLPAIDLLAVRLALTAIASDGRERAVNLATASLADGAFAAQLRQLLADSPRGARGLWLEVSEGAAVGHLDLLRAFAAMVRPLGVRFGLEHAGHLLYRTPRLYELGLDYVKLDAALVRGAGCDDAVRRFVSGSVSLLRALPVLVCAEGVDDAADAAALWECGVEAITGPWATGRVATA